MSAQYSIQPFFTNGTVESYETPEGAENAKWWAEVAFTIVVIGILQINTLCRTVSRVGFQRDAVCTVQTEYKVATS